MKIELEIPDKYEDTNLYLMWGMVPIARRIRTRKYWEVKTAECSRCGKCCENVTERHPFATKDGCKYLGSPGNGNSCSLTIYRPVGCSISDSSLPECTVKWERA